MKIRVRIGSAAIYSLASASAALAFMTSGRAVAQPLRYSPPACPLISYHSALHLGAQRLCMNLNVTTRGTTPRTYLFLTPGGNILHTGAGIFRDNGSLVWWKRDLGPADTNLEVVRFRGRPYLAVWSGRSDFQGPYGSGKVLLFDEHYRRVGTITSGSPFGPSRIDSHEFQITPDGDALFGVYQPVGARFQGRRVEVYQYVVQKVSLVKGPHGIHTGRVLFQWDSLKHVPLSQSHLRPPAPHTVWDYFHGNAVAQDSDGNILVSSRNTWGIYKINVRTGKTMWEVGAKGDRTLAQPWCYQHQITALGRGRYSVFDDGGNGRGCAAETSDHPARGVIFRVSGSHTPVEIQAVSIYAHDPAIYVTGCGSTQLLGGGDVLIGWGQTPEVTEYSPRGTPKMDLSVSNWSYRALRFHWVGLPLTKPSVAASLSARRTTVWTSWNGSTQVTAWRVLAGSSSTHLSPVGLPARKRGFETTIVLHRRYRMVAVQALGASGRVLATSRARPATSS